ncbi:hypothetical protein [Phaffia rhodozyma]|uniref:Uncharacterized protein n=1 Tax=Phaffia rhodozyma TaxID=264483 RepID=A0A0F7SJA4_PHARH|nr:hypothetical protein [Phaffia rhodozyma]
MFSTLAIARSSASSSRRSCVSLRELNTVSDTLNLKGPHRTRLRNPTKPLAKPSPSSSLPVSSTEALPASTLRVAENLSPDKPKDQTGNFAFLDKFFLEAAQAYKDRALNALNHRPYVYVKPSVLPGEPLRTNIGTKPGQLLVKFPEALERTPYLKIVANGPLTREYIDHTFSELDIRTKSVCLLSQQAPDEMFDLGRFVFQVELSSLMNLAMAVGVHWPHFEIISAHLAEDHVGFSNSKTNKLLKANRTKNISLSTYELYFQDDVEFEKIPTATKLPTTDPINTLPIGSHGCHIKIISNQHLDYTYLQSIFSYAPVPIPIYTMWNLPSAEPSAFCLKRRYFCMVQLGSIKDLYRALKLDLPSCRIISIHFDESNLV